MSSDNVDPWFKPSAQRASSSDYQVLFSDVGNLRTRDEIRILIRLKRECGETSPLGSTRLRSWLFADELRNKCPELSEDDIDALDDYCIPYTYDNLPESIARKLSNHGNREELLLRCQSKALSKSDYVDQTLTNSVLPEPSPDTHLHLYNGALGFSIEPIDLHQSLVRVVRFESDDHAPVLYASKRVSRSSNREEHEKALEGFKKDLRALRVGLGHPHLMRYVASFTDRASWATIMLPALSSNLCQLLLDSPNDAQVTQIKGSFICLASTVSFIHSNQLTHNNINPATILIAGDSFKLTDFRPAHHETEWWRYRPLKTLEKSRDLTPDDRARFSDIWALGCVFLDTLDILKRRANIDPLDDLDSRISKSNDWCGSFNDVISEINEWLKDLSIRSTSISGLKGPASWVQRMLGCNNLKRINAQDLVSLIKKYDGVAGFSSACNCEKTQIPTAVPVEATRRQSNAVSHVSMERIPSSQSPAYSDITQCGGSHTTDTRETNMLQWLCSTSLPKKPNLRSTAALMTAIEQLDGDSRLSDPDQANRPVKIDQTPLLVALCHITKYTVGIPGPNQTSPKFEAATVYLYETVPKKADEFYFATRGLVIVPKDMEKMTQRPHIESFWLPLTDVYTRITGSIIELLWSDYFHHVSKERRNGKRIESRIYNPKKPNRGIKLYLENPDEAIEFASCFIQQTEPMVTGQPVHIKLRDTISISNSRQIVLLYDVNREIEGELSKEETICQLTRVVYELDHRIICSRLCIISSELDITITLRDISMDPCRAQLSDYQFRLGNLKSPVYITNIYEEASPCRQDIKCKAPILHITYLPFDISNEETSGGRPDGAMEFFRTLWGWGLEFWANVSQVEMEVTISRLKRWKNLGSATLILWRYKSDSSSTRMLLCFNSNNSSKSKARYMTGSLNSENLVQIDDKSRARILLQNTRKGKDLDVEHMVTFSHGSKEKIPNTGVFRLSFRNSRELKRFRDSAENIVVNPWKD